MRPRRAVLPSGMALALALGLARPASAQEPVSLLPLVVELRIDQGPWGTVIAQVAGERLLLSARQVLALAQVPVTHVVPGASFGMMAPPGDTPLLIRTDSGYVDRRGDRRSLVPGLALWHEGELYLETDLLGRLLGVTVDVDLAALAVTLGNAAHLPAVRQAGPMPAPAVPTAPVAAPPPAPVAADFVTLLIDARIEQGPAGLLFGGAGDTTLLLSAAQLLDLAEVRITALQPDTALTAVLEPSGVRLAIRTDSGFTQRGSVRRPLPRDQAYWVEGTLYVGTGILAELLDVYINANVAELAVVVRDARDLPAVQRVMRERRQAQLQRANGRDRGRMTAVTGGKPAIGGAALDWALGIDNVAPLESGTFEAGLGVEILGGSGLVIHQERWLQEISANARRTDVSWTRVWPTNPYLRQLRLGEVPGTGRAPRQVQGVVVTNSPFVRPALYGTAPLYGSVPPGWEVEIYRNSALVGFTSTGAEGTYAFDVPVLYGTNPVELVAYGPTGEVRRFSRTFEVGRERLAARQFEYGIAGGGCGLDPCAGTLNLDLRYGATRAITLRAGSDWFWRDTLPDLWHPYGSIVLQATRALEFFTEAVGHALLTGRVTFAPTPDVQAGFAHTRFIDSVEAPLVGSAFERDHSTAYGFYRPAVLNRRLLFRADLLRSAGPTRQLRWGRVGLTARSRIGQADVFVLNSRQSSTGMASMTETTAGARVAHEITRPWWLLERTLVQAGAAVNSARGLDAASVQLNRRISRDLSLNLGLDWRDGRGTAFVFALQAGLPSMRYTSQNRLDESGMSGLQLFEGSVLWSERERRPVLGDGRSIGRSGVTGFAFLDTNGNGVRDPDEPGLPGIRVRVGAWLARTDERGRFRVWDVTPFEPLSIEVDPSSATDPQWVPTHQQFLLAPGPNRFMPIEVPFLQTVEVSGTVQLEPEGTSLGGVEVVLEPEGDGPTYRAPVFSDGGYYLMGVRPGTYRVSLAPRVVERLRLVSEPVRLEIPISPTVMIVEAAALRVHRESRPD
jgi:hypothetical protein